MNVLIEGVKTSGRMYESKEKRRDTLTGEEAPRKPRHVQYFHVTQRVGMLSPLSKNTHVTSDV